MVEGGSRHTMIDLSMLESSLNQKIDAKDPFMLPNCCIFKTPEILFRHNNDAFLPNAFSIGPSHHGKENLKATEKIKQKYMQDLVCRSGIPVRSFIEVIDKIEKEARECYAELDVFSKEEFVEMLVLDGCFIIELFRKVSPPEPIDRDDPIYRDDPIFTTSYLQQCLLHDLILLENQIPWKVLEVLFKLAIPGSMPLDQLALRVFEKMFSEHGLSIESLMGTQFADHKSKHLLDLLRNWLVLSVQEEGNDKTSASKGGRWLPFPSATNLEEAGVKFKKVTPVSILDVKFRNGTLEIPSLRIDEVTETIFRNLISFEQCTPNYTPRITSYAIFMDTLIDTTKDLKILRDEKIIDNFLNPAAATQSFNDLFTDALLTKYYYHDLCTELNKYCERRWPKARAYLKVKYFNNPWAIVGVVIGGLIFIFTLMQTVCSVLQTVKQK